MPLTGPRVSLIAKNSKLLNVQFLYSYCKLILKNPLGRFNKVLYCIVCTLQNSKAVFSRNYPSSGSWTQEQNNVEFKHRVLQVPK